MSIPEGCTGIDGHYKINSVMGTIGQYGPSAAHQTRTNDDPEQEQQTSPLLTKLTTSILWALCSPYV